MKQLFFSLLAVAAMASCSKSELAIRPVEGDDVEIMASSKAYGIGDIDVTTRTPFEGAIAADNVLKARVLTTTTDMNYKGTLYADGTMTFTAAKTDETPNNKPYDTTGFTGSYFYPTNGSTIYLCGIYPADLALNTISYSSDGDDVTSYVTATITGCEDFMLAPQVSSTKAQALAKTYPNLAFVHMLTKLTINVKAENEYAHDAWGKIEKITVKEVNSKIQVDLGRAVPYTSTRTNAYTEPVEFKTYIIDQDADPKVATDNAFESQAYELEFDVPADPEVEGSEDKVVDPVAVAYSIVCPVTAVAGSPAYTLIVKTEKIDDPIEVPVYLKKDGADVTGSTAAKKFDVNLTFKATVIEATATVTEWEDGGSAEVPVE
ncbi:MAG: fimbrillin family protein [Alistipes sp.]|nr:fimbrillin family protein [Alistipes sp.]